MLRVVSPTEDSTLGAACDYVRRGWFIAPLHTIAGDCCTCGKTDCISPGKHPRLGRGYQPTRDLRQVKAWWDQYPGSNIGIFTGPSSLVVLDIDPRNGGDESFAELEKRFGELPVTPWVHTGGGGWHLYFWRPAHVEDVRSCAIAPGVEVKGRSGYVVAPTSYHLLGKTYEWDSGRGLETPLADAPAWLLGLARSVRREQSSADPAGPLAGLMGKAFAAAGMLGRQLGADKAAVICPWQGDHSCGRDYDGSTVVFAPTVGHRFGWFHCSHAHCSGRTPDEVLEALPKQSVHAARQAMGLADPVPIEWLAPLELDAPDEPAPIIEPGEDGPDAWRSSLRSGKEGLTKDAGNAALLLGNLPEWRGCVAYDEFSDRYVWMGDAPEGIHGIARPRKGQQFADFHIVYAQTWLAKLGGLAVGSEIIQQGLETAAHMRTYNPVKDYLTGLSWDGKNRLAYSDKYYFRTRTETAAQTFAWFLISAVARVFSPGCQVDHMLILEGLQATRKSTALKILGDPWVLESLPSLRDITRCQEAIQGKWIVVMNELDALRGVEASRAKDFLTMRLDTYRGAYKRFHSDRPRSCVFAGTTNEATYLRDWTGARRFWPIKLAGVVSVRALENDRDQLWAEAVHSYRMGAKWWPEWIGKEDAVFVEQLTGVQEERQDYDELEARISAWLRTSGDGFTMSDLLASGLGVPPERWDRRLQARAGAALTRLGFEARRERSHPGDTARLRRYYRKVVEG